ncbi:hypothetical protein VCR31J2_610001 [Vibrio coralliirubri]|uniref:Uncharacterized protein n=1 Tax=Vibrio coralliirubri TaxID=1516159 RepID=A0AA86WX10_9VIBR|nr:hypothetical protein VCR31J2_610001 [Vibrio coralliirubri]
MFRYIIFKQRAKIDAKHETIRNPHTPKSPYAAAYIFVFALIR